MKTKTLSSKEIKKNWRLIDAQDVVLGKVASNAAYYLRGKHKPTYSPHMDDGDYVVVVNAGKVKLTGNKWKQKIYYSHSGYPGGLKETPYNRLLEKKPAFIVEKAIKGMLSNNRLGRKQYRNLRVYAGPDHEHSAQEPKAIELK